MISSSILGTYQPGGFISFSVPSFCLFILFMGLSRQEYLSGLPFPSPMDHILSELRTMTCPSWVALHAWPWGDTPHPMSREAAALNWSGREEIPHIQGQRRSPSKTVGGANLHSELDPVPARDAQRAWAGLLCIRTWGPHRDWDRIVLEHLLWRCGLVLDCCSGWSRLGYGICPLGGGCHWPTAELPELTQDWEADSWRTQVEPCMHLDPGEGSGDPVGD